MGFFLAKMYTKRTVNYIYIICLKSVHILYSNEQLNMLAINFKIHLPTDNKLSFFQGHLSAGTKVLYEYLHTEPKKLMILGPFDNDLAKTVAAYAGLPEIGILQVKIIYMYSVMLVKTFHMIVYRFSQCGEKLEMRVHSILYNYF